MGDILVGNGNANVILAGAGDDVLVGGGGNDSLHGESGNDTYLFDADVPLGSVLVGETAGGVDTLDFSATTGLAITVNLGQPTLQVVNANLSLTLGVGSTIENVIGGSLGDTLTGNERANKNALRDRHPPATRTGRLATARS